MLLRLHSVLLITLCYPILSMLTLLDDGGKYQEVEVDGTTGKVKG